MRSFFWPHYDTSDTPVLVVHLLWIPSLSKGPARILQQIFLRKHVFFFAFSARGGPWEFSMKLLELRDEAIRLGPSEGVCLPFSTCRQVAKIRVAATRVLADYKVSISDSLSATQSAAWLPANIPESGGLLPTSVGDPAAILRHLHSDFVQRCRHAKNSGRACQRQLNSDPPRRSKSDPPSLV